MPKSGILADFFAKFIQHGARKGERFNPPWHPDRLRRHFTGDATLIHDSRGGARRILHGPISRREWKRQRLARRKANARRRQNCRHGMHGS